MATELGIWNLALSHLGRDANVSSPTESSAEAAYCRQFYATARDQLLAMHAWNFATKRVALALLDNDVDSWAFSYARPADMLEPVALLLPGSTDDTDAQDYVQELNGEDARVIRTNVEDAVLKYTKLVTDPTRFTPLFAMALSFLLAYYMAGPLTHDEKKQASLFKMAMSLLGKASSNDANGQMNELYTNGYVPDLTGRTAVSQDADE